MAKIVAREFYRLLALACVFAIATSVFAQQSLSSRTQIYTTNAQENNRPKPASYGEFDCSDKIYTVVTAQGLTPGKHQIEVRWVDANDEQRELTNFEFFSSKNQASTTVWAWLLLHRARGAGMLKLINPAAGYEDSIGPWKVKVFIDGEFAGDGGFTVSC